MALQISTTVDSDIPSWAHYYKLYVKESELLEAYEEFDLGWEVWPAHILSETEEDARKVIDELHKGTSFSEVAKQYSRADDAIKGGNLGSFFGQGDVVPALREATFFLDEGEFSEPIRTKDGWEIVIFPTASVL